MKSFIVAVIIFAIMVTGSLVSVWQIDRVAENMAEKNEKITMAVENNDFAAAKTLAEELGDYVEEKRTLLSSIIEHNYVDNIEIYICELERYIDGEIKSDALAKTNVLDMQFHHLSKNYKLRIENIF